MTHSKFWKFCRSPILGSHFPDPLGAQRPFPFRRANRPEIRTVSQKGPCSGGFGHP